MLSRKTGRTKKFDPFAKDRFATEATFLGRPPRRVVPLTPVGKRKYPRRERERVSCRIIWAILAFASTVVVLLYTNQILSTSSATILYHVLHLTCIGQTYLPLSLDISPFCEGAAYYYTPIHNDPGPAIADRFIGIEDRLQNIELAFFKESRHNVALRGGGGKVLTDLTSPTMGLLPLNGVRRVLSLLRGLDVYNDHINPPIVVLEDDLTVGECWEFAGSRGHLAIIIPRPTIISDIAIKNPLPSLLSALDRGRAPKYLRYWGLVELTALNDHQELVTRSWADFVTSTPQPTPQHENLLDGRTLVLLGEAMFNIVEPSQLKTVAVNHGVNVLVSHLVVVEVLENWGANSTCVYHIAIYEGGEGA